VQLKPVEALEPGPHWTRQWMRQWWKKQSLLSAADIDQDSVWALCLESTRSDGFGGRVSAYERRTC
jgi:hypothetical protein